MGDSDNRNEMLFWKVFHNKYLLQQIIKQIHETEWVKYDDPKEIHVYNRCKFKDTHSLSGMIKNKLYSLIRHKVEFGDYIRVTREAIFLFFKSLHERRGVIIYESDSELLKSKKYQKLLKDLPKTTEQDRIELKSILILLLSKRLDFIVCDLVKVATLCNNIEVLRLLINEPYSMIVYPSTLEAAIHKCNTEIVQEFINLQIKINNDNTNTINHGVTIITDDIKEKSLNMVLKKTPDVINKVTAKLQNNHWSIMINFILDNPILYSLSKPTKPITTTTTTMKTESPTVQSDLIEAEEQPTKRLKISHDDNIGTKVIKPVAFTSFLELKCIKTKNRLMDLNLVLREETKKYKLKVHMHYTFEELSTTLRIIFNYKCVEKLISCIKITQEFQDKCNQIINSYIGNSNSNSIVEDDKNDIRLKELRKLVAINIGGGDFYKYYKMLYNETIEECEPFVEIGDEQRSLVFIHKIVKRAIKECDIKQLEALKSEEYRALIGYVQFEELPSSNEDLIKLLDYFGNDCNFGDFSLHLTDFYKKVVEIIPPTSIKLNIKTADDWGAVYGPFISSLSNYNFKLTEMFIHNLKSVPGDTIIVHPINFIQHREETTRIIISSESFRKNSINFIKKVTFEQILSIIHVFINEFPKSLTFQIQIGGEGGQVPLIIDSFLNYLFELCLRIKGISLTQINQVYQLLLSNSVDIDCYFNKSVLYLQIRDPKLSKYIIDLDPRILKLDRLDDIPAEDEEEVEPFGSNYYDTDILTYQYILGRNEDGTGFINSFDDILNELINQLSHKVCKDINQFKDEKGEVFFTRTLNHSLCFFLEIRRVDLFFKHLQWINQFIQDNNNNNSHPYQESFTFNSASELIKSTSTLFDKKYKPTMPPYSSSNSQFEGVSTSLLFPVSKTIPIFQISESVLRAACLVMNIEEIQQLIEFKFYETNFLKYIYFAGLVLGRFEMVSFILDNYSIKNPIKNPLQFASHNSYLELEFINNNRNLYETDKSKLQSTKDLFRQGVLNQFYNYLSNTNYTKEIVDFIGSQVSGNMDTVFDTFHCRYDSFRVGVMIDSNEIEKESMRVNRNRKEMLSTLLINNLETQQSLKTKFENYLISSKSSRLENKQKKEQNLFTYLFNQGDIKLCNSLLNFYPHQFTQRLLSELIKTSNIHIIKYYFNTKIKNDNQLYNHLKTELLKHKDYKFDLNWL